MWHCRCVVFISVCRNHVDYADIGDGPAGMWGAAAVSGCTGEEPGTLGQWICILLVVGGGKGFMGGVRGGLWHAVWKE